MLLTPVDTSPPAPDLRAARRWLGLAITVLVVAGLFAVAVVVGRMPPFDRFVSDPLFFRRCLVGHVNMALIAWFYSFVAALLCLLPRRVPSGRLVRASALLGGGSVVLMLIGAGMPGSQPVLSNYIPTIDHWMFRAGQLGFGVAVLASLVDRGVFRGVREQPGAIKLPAGSRAALRGAAVGLLLAAATFAVAATNQPESVEPEVYYELLFWGGGHVLQLVSVLAMLAVWLMLLAPALGRSPVSGRAVSALVLAMLGPWMISPLLALQGTESSSYRAGFTQLMQWGIAPGLGVFLILCVRALWHAWSEGRIGTRSLGDPRISAFLVSAGLTLLGVVLGAAIRGSSTMVPAHYHASVGAVTVAFMAATYRILGAAELVSGGSPLRRAAAWQPALYGVGMLLFASGFALAGAHGMGRKVYGAEQAVRSLAETIGLGVMGLGGFIAVAGGLLFLGVVAAVGWRRARIPQSRELAQSSWRWRYGVRRIG